MFESDDFQAIPKKYMERNVLRKDVEKATP